MTPEPTTGYVDAEGNPIDALRWADLSRNNEYGLLAEDTADPLIVQTRWHGINVPDHGTQPFGVTLSIRQGSVTHTVEVATYPDRAAALAGHKIILAALKAAKTTRTYTLALQETLWPPRTSHP